MRCLSPTHCLDLMYTVAARGACGLLSTDNLQIWVRDHGVWAFSMIQTRARSCSGRDIWFSFRYGNSDPNRAGPPPCPCQAAIKPLSVSLPVNDFPKQLECDRNGQVCEEPDLCIHGRFSLEWLWDISFLLSKNLMNRLLFMSSAPRGGYSSPS